ncbi:hypothetical protein [uncultured Dialister sp.]|uniref:hypothetical protein n=1 Tax=uncultured Dialister sp. TaxID=278064 RepID=UPI00265F7F9D|nr:hypothetical protein [uncultured Dialister sp.]
MINEYIRNDSKDWKPAGNRKGARETKQEPSLSDAVTSLVTFIIAQPYFRVNDPALEYFYICRNAFLFLDTDFKK